MPPQPRKRAPKRIDPDARVPRPTPRTYDHLERRIPGAGGRPVRRHLAGRLDHNGAAPQYSELVPEGFGLNGEHRSPRQRRDDHGQAHDLVQAPGLPVGPHGHDEPRRQEGSDAREAFALPELAVLEEQVPAAGNDLVKHGSSYAWMEARGRSEGFDLLGRYAVRLEQVRRVRLGRPPARPDRPAGHRAWCDCDPCWVVRRAQMRRCS